MLKPEIYIEGLKLDLFDDENITIISSVQNIEDISRTFNDFSQSFTTPASARNNQIAKHFYNASIDNGFDARVRHTAQIDIQSIPFKRGSMRLESCKIEDNRPVHYKWTFFGQLVSLKELIGEDYLSALDLSEYDIAYSSDNIITGLTTGFSSGEYVFPLISTKRQWYYNSLVSDTTYSDSLANIAANGSVADHGMGWESLRPALLVMRIIEGIESKYGLTFSRDFLGTTPFDGLYLWLANADTEEALTQRTTVTDYETVNTWQPAIGSFSNTTGKYTPTTSGASKLRQIIFDCNSSDGVFYRIQLMNGDIVLEEDSGTGDLRIDRNIPGGFEPGAEIYGRIVTTATKTIDQAYFEIDELSDDQVLDATRTNFVLTGSIANVTDFIPKIKIMDFIKSLINMYNLTVVPASSTEFEIETLDEWYAKGNTYDISAFVDTSQSIVNRSKIYREIAFKFQEPQTILADQFNKINNVPYGDLQTKLKNADGTALDGERFDIELDFEQMVYEKLINTNTEVATNVVYGLSLDKGLSDTTPEPHLLYIRQESVALNQLYIVQDDGTKATLSGNVYMPSHVEGTNKLYSTVFGSELDEHSSSTITNSLFELYYKDYITDSFNMKRRKYDYEAVFPLWLLNKIKLNDKLIIGTDRYLINKMDVNVTTQRVKLELLNDIYGVTSDVEIEEKETPVVTPPVNSGTSFALPTTGEATHLGACSANYTTATKYWTGGANPTLGDYIYNELNMTTIYNGGGLWYRIIGPSGDLTIKIETSGIVSNIYDCTAGAFP